MLLLLNWPAALPGNISDLPRLPSRFNNNNCQSPVSSARQVAGEGINGVKACSSTGVGWSRPGEGEATSRLGDKTSAGKRNSANIETKNDFYCAITCLPTSLPITHMSLRPTDTVVSKAVIPRLQPSEQSSHVSPNKSSKVSRSQPAPCCV